MEEIICIEDKIVVDVVDLNVGNVCSEEVDISEYNKNKNEREEIKVVVEKF